MPLPSLLSALFSVASLTAPISCLLLSDVGLSCSLGENREVGAFSRGPLVPGPLLIQGHLDLLKPKQLVQ